MVNSDDNLTRILVDSGADTHAIDGDGITLLYDATKIGSVLVLRYLLTRGVDPNSRNKNEETPLHFTSTHKHRSITHLLLANRSTDISAKDNNEQTPMHDAAAFGHSGTVQELVIKGANVDTQD